MAWLLWPVSLGLTWLVAQGIAGKPFDRALEYNVGALAQLITVNKNHAQFALPLPARELLRADDRPGRRLVLGGTLLDRHLPGLAELEDRRRDRDDEHEEEDEEEDTDERRRSLVRGHTQQSSAH